ncbi:MAG: cell division protein ZapB [Chitinispirillales bacterium]|nr:cell division protein ZapB [Chitinispirillales bacterium]
MEMEFLSELENKIGALVDTVGGLKAENERIKAEFNDGMAGLRGENEDLKRQIEELRTASDADRGRMADAAERVKELLAKIDTAL